MGRESLHGPRNTFPPNGGVLSKQRIKDETKATIRVLPDEEFRTADAPTTCLKCGSGSTTEAVWARAY